MRAGRDTLLFFAVFHTIILMGQFFIYRNADRLIIFRILGIADFYKELGTGWEMVGVSVLLYMSIFLFFFRFQKRK